MDYILFCLELVSCGKPDDELKRADMPLKVVNRGSQNGMEKDVNVESVDNFVLL